MAEEKKEAPKKAKKIAAYRPKRSCPKCGTGVHLAEHADRFACGKCGYFEKKMKK